MSLAHRALLESGVRLAPPFDRAIEVQENADSWTQVEKLPLHA